MSVTVELPELGESVVEGTVARWLVKEGERVELDQPLVEVTTDKVDAEIPSPSAGVLEKILVAEGETVAVGTELARIDPAGEAAETAQAERPEPRPRREAPAADARRGEAQERRAGAEAPARREEAQAARAGGAGREAPPERPGAEETPRATPVGRRAAEAAGVDLRDVTGTGAGGRITRADVEYHAGRVRGVEERDEERAERPARPAPAAREPARPEPAPAPERGRPLPWMPTAETYERFGRYTLQEGDRVTPMSPLRRLVAEHMVYSKHVSPHVGTVAEVDLGGVVAVRERQKRSFQEAHGFALTYLPFVVHATVRALREFPALNASVVEDAIVEKKDIHVGIAVETEKGLVVPVVRHADRLSLAGLAAAVEDLSARARSKRLSADELKGGTFTVSNPGRHGNLYGFAIINQPQVGILRMGEIVKRPVVRGVDGQDAIVIRPTMHLALSYDHRAVDGAPANAFLYRVRELLEEAEFDL